MVWYIQICLLLFFAMLVPLKMTKIWSLGFQCRKAVSHELLNFFIFKHCITLYVWTIARYGYVWNVHRVSIKTEHRNLEIWKTRNDFFVQVLNFLLPLSLKVLRHKEREAQSFYSGLFISPHPLTHLVWHQRSPRASESQPSSPEAGLISTNFLQIPKILRALPVRDVIHTC